MRASLSLVGVALVMSASPTTPAVDADAIIRRSMMANQTDWAASPQYEYMERTHTDDGTNTYEVTMLLGTPYKRLVTLDGKSLSTGDQRKEDERLSDEREARGAESSEERAQRLADYEKTREEAHRILEEMPRAFAYRMASTRHVGSRTVYVLEAAPKKGYVPPSTAAKVLAGMRGEFWIDSATFQWVKATARVLKPVSIAGFLVRVQPGTEFEVEQMPVDGDVWLPRHFEVRSRSSILFFFHHHTFDERTYSNYRRISGS